MKLHRISSPLLGGLLLTGLIIPAANATVDYPGPDLDGHVTVVGALSAPAKGPGPGVVEQWKVGTAQIDQGQFGMPGTRAGNSLYAAYDPLHNNIYVATPVGRTDVLNGDGLGSIGSFASLKGARIARVTPDSEWVLELSPHALAAYSTLDWKQRFKLPVGGNALAFAPDGGHVFIGGNKDATITELALPSGKIERHFKVGHSGDLVWANSELYSADMKNGVLTALNPDTGQITRIRTPEVDPAFSYRNIPAARAGFMQIAVSPDQQHIYIAGFSGHILKFSTVSDSFQGEVPVKAGAHGPNKLSGLAIIDDGAEAMVTVENRNESVVVRLADGTILKKLPGAVSNRWVTYHT